MFVELARVGLGPHAVDGGVEGLRGRGGELDGGGGGFAGRGETESKDGGDVRHFGMWISSGRVLILLSMLQGDKTRSGGLRERRRG